VQLIDLSHVIASGMAQWPTDNQPLQLHRRSEHSSEGTGTHMSSAMEIGCHVGTHLDGPLHFSAMAPPIDEMPVDAFAGNAVVVKVPQTNPPVAFSVDVMTGINLGNVDFVLFDTGWNEHWGTPRYYEEWPFIAPELASLLAGAGLKGVGLDTPSLDAMSGHLAHDICAAAGMVNIENLTNLKALPAAEFYFMALPLKLQGTEASPVRAVGLIPAGDNS
jgi:arylformamidase